MNSTPNSKFEFVLRMADSDLILAQRLVAWCGHGPMLEEDMALSNVALDLLGQARLWYRLAGEMEGLRRSEDDFAFNRDVGQWRNALLAEQPNGSYAHTLVRQFLFDHYHFALLMMLRQANEGAIAEIAEKCVKEVAYHVRRSDDLIVRLGDGSAHSHDRMAAALLDVWPHGANLFSEQVGAALDHIVGEAHSMDRLRVQWQTAVEAVLLAATLSLPPAHTARAQSRDTHTEHLGPLLAEMQFLQRAYPGARW